MLLTREVTVRTWAPGNHLGQAEVILGNGNLDGAFALHPSTDESGGRTYFLARDGMVVSHGVHLPRFFSRILRSPGRKVVVNEVYAAYSLADDAYAVDVKVGIG